MQTRKRALSSASAPPPAIAKSATDSRVKRLGYAAMLPDDIVHLVCEYLTPNDAAVMAALGSPFSRAVDSLVDKHSVANRLSHMPFGRCVMLARSLVPFLSLSGRKKLLTQVRHLVDRPNRERRAFLIALIDPAYPNKLLRSCSSRLRETLRLAHSDGTDTAGIDCPALLAIDMRMPDLAVKLFTPHTRTSPGMFGAYCIEQRGLRRLFNCAVIDHAESPAHMLARVIAVGDLFSVDYALRAYARCDNLHTALAKVRSNKARPRLSERMLLAIEHCRPPQEFVTACLITECKNPDADPRILEAYECHPFDGVAVCRALFETGRYRSGQRYLLYVRDSADAGIMFKALLRGRPAGDTVFAVCTHPAMWPHMQTHDALQVLMECGLSSMPFFGLRARGLQLSNPRRVLKAAVGRQDAAIVRALLLDPALTDADITNVVCDCLQTADKDLSTILLLLLDTGRVEMRGIIAALSDRAGFPGLAQHYRTN